FLIYRIYSADQGSMPPNSAGVPLPAVTIRDAASRPSNATAEHGVTWLDAGRFLDGQLTFRMLLADAPLLQELRRALDTGETSPRAAPFVPASALCSRASFEAGGFEGCRAASEAARRGGATLPRRWGAPGRRAAASRRSRGPATAGASTPRRRSDPSPP